MNEQTVRMLGFIKEIGIPYHLETIKGDTFLPGLKLRNGSLIIDIEKLLYPGDILHEAGHLACMPPGIRNMMSDSLDNSSIHQGGEMMAIAWSYAACLYLDIDPEIVFHKNGYKQGAENIIANFNKHQYFGVPLLEWCGMCYSYERAKKFSKQPYPVMITWTCQNNMYHTSI